VIIALSLGGLSRRIQDLLFPYEFVTHESRWLARRFIHKHDSPSNLLLACAAGREAPRLVRTLNRTRPLSYAQKLVLTVDPWWTSVWGEQNFNRTTLHLKVPVTRAINVVALDSGALLQTGENRIVHGYERSTVAESPHVEAALRELIRQARGE